MELNKLHESTKVLTPDGYLSLAYILSENRDGIFKVYVKGEGFVDAKINTDTIDVPFRITTTKLSNGMVNITTDTTQYLMSTDSSIAAAAIQGRNLQSIRQINEFNTPFSYAGLIANMFRYSFRESNYFTRDEFIPCRDDLFSLLGTDLRGKCIDDIWLQHPKLLDNVFDVYKSWPSMNNPTIPKDIDSWHITDSASWLRGVLTVMIDMSKTEIVTFKMPGEEFAGSISRLLTSIGVANTIHGEKEFVPLRSLGNTEKTAWVYYITIESSVIDLFMTKVGVMTSETIEFIYKVAKYKGTEAIDVTTESKESSSISNKFYSIYREPANEFNSFWIIVGGVYVKMYK